jgi:hypothetical protein
MMTTAAITMPTMRATFDLEADFAVAGELAAIVDVADALEPVVEVSWTPLSFVDSSYYAANTRLLSKIDSY